MKGFTGRRRMGEKLAGGGGARGAREVEKESLYAEASHLEVTINCTLTAPLGAYIPFVSRRLIRRPAACR